LRVVAPPFGAVRFGGNKVTHGLAVIFLGRLGRPFLTRVSRLAGVQDEKFLFSHNPLRDLARPTLVFTTFPCHNLPKDLDLMRKIDKDIMTTMSSQCTPTITPQSKLNSEASLWNMSWKATTSVSSSVFDGSVGEEGLSYQLKY
jgi:hypothetical protein